MVILPVTVCAEQSLSFFDLKMDAHGNFYGGYSLDNALADWLDSILQEPISPGEPIRQPAVTIDLTSDEVLWKPGWSKYDPIRIDVDE